MTAGGPDNGSRWLKLGLLAVVWLMVLNTVRGRVADPDLRREPRLTPETLDRAGAVYFV